MIWIVSKDAANSAEHMSSRHQYIEDVTQARVSPWQERACAVDCRLERPVKFFQCKSDKGEYGVVITAHFEEVWSLIYHVITAKKAIIAVNSCVLHREYLKEFSAIVMEKNPHSELYFAKQKWYEEDKPKTLVNFVDNIGSFGFATTESERELFRRRNLGLTRAIRLSYEKVNEV